MVSAAKDFLVAPLASLSASGERVSKHLTDLNGWHFEHIKIVEDKPPLSISLMEGVRIRWEVKVKNHNRLPVIIKFIPSDDVCDSFIEYVAHLRDQIQAKNAEGVDAGKGLTSLEEELQQSTKAMQDLQAERDAKKKESGARVGQKDELKILCNLFLKITPSSPQRAGQKALGLRKWKFGVGSKFVARTHARTHAHTQNNKHARQGK